jgi:tetratricopeptide (TPR) repeat protein
MHLGGVLFLLGRAAEAKHALELALRIAPDLVGAWRNLAAVHSAQGDWDAAVRCLEAAIAVSPSPAALQGDLALALESCLRLEDAAAAARASLLARPVPGPTASRYAGLMQRMGRDEEGRAFLRELATQFGEPRLLQSIEEVPPSR